MFEEEEEQARVIQKIVLKPKSIILYSVKTLNVLFERCKEDIVYLDATGSIVRRDQGQNSPFYIYELIVRHPKKGPPLFLWPRMSQVTTQQYPSFFLGSVVTEFIRHHGPKARTRPVIICDGSVVLLQSLSYNFCGVTSLQELLCRYFRVVTREASEDCIGLPILYRCLGHIMKNAKGLSKKQ